MVRLGKVTPKIWEDLESQGFTQDSIEEAAAAAEAAKEKAAQLAREAIAEAGKVDWRKTADAAKTAREIDEKYGMFKDIILSPWFQKLLRVWEKVKGIQLLGEPRMAPAAIVVLMFMLLRAKQPTHVLVLVAAWFYNVHPLLIFSVAGVVWIWAKVRKPRGYRAATAPKRTVDAIAETSLKSEDMSKLGAEKFDHVVIGADIGGLYCAAMLSKLGHKVLVLEAAKTPGQCTMTHKGLPFDWGYHSVGSVEVFDELLRSVMLEGADDLHWVKIGTEADGFSYDVATVGDLGDVVYRAGRAALVDDQVTTAPDHRDKVGPFVAKVDAAAREQHAFFVGKLFKQSTAGWLQSMLGATYATAGAHTAEHIFNNNLPEFEKLDLLRGFFRLENLPPSELSFAAYASSLSHGLDGVSYPWGGYVAVSRALIGTIRATGGRVLTDAPVKAILLDEPANQVATGVRLENGEVIKPSGAIISSAGIVPTYAQMLPPKVPLPSGVSGAKEARPRLVTLVVLKGSAEELDLPASDYWNVVTENSAHDWMHISFPCAKDPSWGESSPDRWNCVIETEADDDVLEVLYRKDVTPTAPGQRPTSAQANAAQKQGEDKGLQYYKMKPPSDQKLKRMQAVLLKRLVELFPQLEGRVEEYQTLGPYRQGLSHTPARFRARGLRPTTGVKNLYLCGKDLTLGTLAGGIYGGWLAAHAVVGYTALDVLLFQRNIIKDLRNTNATPPR